MRVATRVQSKLRMLTASCHTRPNQAEQAQCELPLASNPGRASPLRAAACVQSTLSKAHSSCHPCRCSRALIAATYWWCTSPLGSGRRAEQAQCEVPLLSLFARTDCRNVSGAVRLHFGSGHRADQGPMRATWNSETIASSCNQRHQIINRGGRTQGQRLYIRPSSKSFSPSDSACIFRAICTTLSGNSANFAKCSSLHQGSASKEHRCAHRQVKGQTHHHGRSFCSKK